MKSKKSQIGMMESVMVLFVFFVIISLGFMFYSKMQETKIKTMQNEMFEKNAILAAQNILYLPELQCSEKNVITDICYDEYKVQAFSDDVVPSNPETFLFYKREFGDSLITIRKILPPPEDPDAPAIVIFDNTPIDSEEKSMITTSLPVSLKDPSKRFSQYSVGLLEIKVFK